MEKMIKNREGFLVGKTYRQCTNKSCLSVFKITSKTVTFCPLCNSERVKSVPEEKKMLNRAKMRAIKQNIPFSITEKDVVIPEYCPILGIKLEHHRGKPGAYKNSPSLDRIIPEKGYVSGNVRVISQLANQCKGSATPEELLLFAKWIIVTFENNTDMYK
jgi:hypothetical protein